MDPAMIEAIQAIKFEGKNFRCVPKNRSNC